MDTYICSRCKKPCQPRLCEPGVTSDCCSEYEPPLLVADCFDPETCTGCEDYRPLTEDEERDLIEELTAEEQGEWTDAMRAHNNWLNRS
jgi:hypothetical protein